MRRHWDRAGCEERGHGLFGIGRPGLVLGTSTWLVKGVVVVELTAEFADPFPFGTFTGAELESVSGQGFESAHVPALGKDLQQLAMNGYARRIHPQGFLEDFLSLKVSAVGQVHIRFGDRVDVTCGIQLAG